MPDPFLLFFSPLIQNICTFNAVSLLVIDAFYFMQFADHSRMQPPSKIPPWWGEDYNSESSGISSGSKCICNFYRENMKKDVFAFLCFLKKKKKKKKKKKILERKFVVGND